MTVQWVLQCNMPQVAMQASLMSFLILLRLPLPLQSESSERVLTTGCSILGDVQVTARPGVFQCGYLIA